MRLFNYICLYLLIAAPALASAGGPLEDLRRGVDEGIQILEDSRYKDNSLKSDQQQKLWEVMQQTFDFSEFSRRVLASHYKNFNPQQRNEFSRTFAEFLGKFYLSRLQRRYNGEKIFYIDEKLVSESRALIAIEVLWKNV
ncbi:MAG: ABC transporter substrate-binding protein, partial [Desulfobacterales bacterium]